MLPVKRERNIMKLCGSAVNVSVKNVYRDFKNKIIFTEQSFASLTVISVKYPLQSAINT